MPLNEENVKKYGVTYEDFVKGFAREGTRRRWKIGYERVEFTQEHYDVFKQPSQMINIVVFAADWCGDCVNIVPILRKIEEKCHYISLHVIDIDKYPEEFEKYHTNGEKRIPAIVFLSPDYKEVNRWIERSTYTYRLYADVRVLAGKDKEKYRKMVNDAFFENQDKVRSSSVNEIVQALAKSSSLVRTSTRLMDYPTVV